MINKNYLEDYINNLEKSLYPSITYLTQLSHIKPNCFLV
jgi:hypothetical protein